MAGTIPELTSLPISDRTTNLLEVCDVNGNVSYKATPNFLLGITGAPIGTTDSQTLTNKILTAPTISSPTLSGTLTGTYVIGGTPTFPSSVATLTGTQTFTNKTLTSPTITSPTITNASITADAISGFTSANTGTIYGMAVTAGILSSTALPSTISTTKLTNPHKFSVYRSAAQSAAAGSFSKVQFDSKLFDTGTNFDATTNYRFIAPVAGYYQFNASASSGSSSAVWIVSFYKNGTEFTRGAKTNGTTAPGSVHTDILQLNATDYVEVFVFSTSAVAIEVGATAPHASFSGFLVSTT